MKAKKDWTAEFAAVLDCSDKFIQTRLIALGHSTTCGRCGGGGQYSYCQMYGTTCFGCRGSGNVATKLTKKLLDTVREQVARGELQPYIDECRAKADRKAKVKNARERFSAAWTANPSVHADKDVHFTRQSARTTDINHFCSPLFKEVSSLVQLVEKGEWSTEKRKYVAVSAEAQDNAVARIEECIALAAKAEELAPRTKWNESLNSE